MHDIIPQPPTPPAVFSGAQERRRQLYDAWLAGRKATTVRAYRSDASHFAQWAGHPDATAAVEWLFALDGGQANHVVLNYRNAMVDDGLSAATVSRRLSSLKSLGQLARVLGVCLWSIEIDSPQAERYRDVTGPGEQGYARMQQTARADKSDQGIRDHAIVTLLHDLALRRSEAVGLMMDHVVFETAYEHGHQIRRATAVWVHGKGRQDPERISLPMTTGQALIRWLDIRGPEAGPVFLRLDRNAHGTPRTPLTGEAVRLICARISKAAGLDKICRPHGLRHESISRALDVTNGDIRAVAKFSRHRNIQTVAIYDDRRRDEFLRIASLVAEGD